MSKKLGVILLFVGAYIILLGGLFWNMSLPKPTPDGAFAGNVYDWVWGITCGIIVAGGAALCIKKNWLCLLGLGVCAIGLVCSILVTIIGASREAYTSVWIIIGSILVALGIVVTTVFYFKEAAHIKKHGAILM